MRKNLVRLILGVTLMSTISGCGVKEKVSDLIHKNKQETAVTEEITETEENAAESAETIKEVVYEEIDTNRYYYNQLSDESKTVYDALVQNVDMLINNQELIVLDNILSDSGIPKKQIDEIMEPILSALLNDKPEFSICFSGFSYTMGANVITNGSKYEGIESYKIVVYPMKEKGTFGEFSTSEETKTAMNETEAVVNEFVKSIQSLSDKEKAIEIHNWILQDAKYDHTVSVPNLRSTYGAIIQKECVCAGFAHAFKYVADKAGLDVITVTGMGYPPSDDTMEAGPHAWNNIFLDGEWTLVDLTWDCQTEYAYEEQEESYINEDGYLVQSITMTPVGFTNGDEYLFKPLSETTSTHVPDEYFDVPLP